MINFHWHTLSLHCNDYRAMNASKNAGVQHTLCRCVHTLASFGFCSLPLPSFHLSANHGHVMMSASTKCLYCKNSCWDRQLLIKCSLCQSKFHAKCLNAGDSIIIRNSYRYRNYNCDTCLKLILPFQNLSEDTFRDEIDDISLLHFLTNANLKCNQLTEDDFDNIKPDKYIFYDQIQNSFIHNEKELTILHVNIVSLITNFDKLKELLDATKNMPDLICISETRLKKKHKKSDIPQLQGYEFENVNSTLSAGGVGIYYRSVLDITIRHDLNMKQNDCEDLCLQIKIPNLKPIVIAAVYRHPKYNYENF